MRGQQGLVTEMYNPRKAGIREYDKLVNNTCTRTDCSRSSLGGSNISYHNRNSAESDSRCAAADIKQGTQQLKSSPYGP